MSPTTNKNYQDVKSLVHGPGKRKNLLINMLFIFFLLQHQTVSSQIITNGGFENWATGTSGYQDPVGWSTNNVNSFAPLVMQAAGRTGTYSVNLTSVSNGIGGYFGGGINLSYSGSLKPLSFSGYWKGNFLTSSTAMNITVSVSDASSNSIGAGNITTPASANITSWTPFSFNVNYSSSNAPATTLVLVQLSTSSATTSGYLDDLSLTYITAIGEIQTAHLLGASLNYDFQSGNYFLNADLLAPSSFDVTIYDVNGRKVCSKNYSLQNGHHEIPVSTQQLPHGIYLCRILGDSMGKAIKFVK